MDAGSVPKGADEAHQTQEQVLMYAIPAEQVRKKFEAFLAQVNDEQLAAELQVLLNDIMREQTFFVHGSEIR